VYKLCSLLKINTSFSKGYVICYDFSRRNKTIIFNYFFIFKLTLEEQFGVGGCGVLCEVLRTKS
jgi:hypothetical protein